MFGKLIGTLILVSAVTVAGYEMAEEVRPVAEEAAAQESMRRVVDAAYLYYQFSNDWHSSLQVASVELKRTDNIKVDGYTITWLNEEGCYAADVPTPDTVVEVAPC